MTSFNQRTIICIMILALTTVLFSSCTPKVVKDTTLQTANNIDQLENEMRTYQAFLNKAAAARLERMQDQHDRLVRFNQQPQARPAELWKVAKRKEALDLLEGVFSMAKKVFDTQVTDPLVDSKASLREAKTKFNTQSNQMKSVSKQLTALASGTTLEDFSNWIEFIKQVAAQISDMEENADNPEGAVDPPNSGNKNLTSPTSDSNSNTEPTS